MKNDKPFEFPETILNSINECTNGFALVICNEDGSLSLFHKADNEVNFLAMVEQLRHFVNAVDMSSSQSLMQEMFGQEESEE